MMLKFILLALALSLGACGAAEPEVKCFDALNGKALSWDCPVVKKGS